MIEKIGKTKLNYEFYRGRDSYSDGDVEDDLLKLVQSNVDVMKVLNHDDRWPILYHLSPIRQNIVGWYPFEDNAEILEVGSGCGAITGALCQKARKVTCVELSKRRSMINATRNQNHGNLEILVGNFNQIEWDNKFDYITLIGVLEYAAYYTQADEPFVGFLKNMKRLLKENGKILIAIENKFGLKYWVGYKEDHTGVLFDGLEGYKSKNSKVKTFSKKELQVIFHDAGYRKAEFYYPYPDYKFPMQIFSDEWMPKAEDLLDEGISYDNSRYKLFDESAVWTQILRDDMFGFFSNSFFIELS